MAGTATVTVECAKRVIVTGATGFVGRALVTRLARESGWIVRAAHRGRTALSADVEQVAVSDLGPDTDWSDALNGCDVVVHAAARVHVMRDRAANPLAKFRAVNVDGTLRLAREAVAAGVRRFVFVSSIKVNGEATLPGRPFTSKDAPAPADAYGVSKREAEDELRALSRETGMELVIVRPVLVYGPGVKANFRAMIRWLYRGIPLPLGATQNQRSLVAIENLVDLLVRCLAHPAAVGETLLVSDAEDLSTTELLQRMSRALGRPARLFPVPPALIRAAAHLAGKRDLAQRLLGSLQVDTSRTRALLEWTPPVTVDAALARVAADFLAHEAR